MAKRNSTPLFGEPVNKEVPEIKGSVKKKVPLKTTPKKEVPKVTKPKKEIPLKVVEKKVSVKKPKPISKPIIEIKEEVLEENVVEDLPSPIPKEKKKKEIKNDPPKVIKHKLKVGTNVIATFLGSPTKAVIIELSPEGMYKVKAERGTILPRAKHIEGEIPDKTYPSYIIKVL